MMEEALYGCDVMPSAVHITGSTLSGVEPSVLFNSSHLYTMPYGRMADNSVMIGSLELLQSSNVLTAVQHQRPGHAHRQHWRGDGRPGTHRYTRRELRSGDNEPSLYPERDPRRRIR